MKKVFSLLIIFIAVQVSVFGVAGGKDMLSQEERQWLIKHDGKIRYAPLPNYPPIEFVDSEGTHQGVTADYLRRIEQNLDFRFAKVQANSWNEIISKAKQGEIDVIGSIQNTPERNEYLRFTKPYLEIPNAIIVREENHRPLTLETMGGMNIAIGKGYASVTFIKNKNPKIILEEVNNDLAGLQMVSFGRADAIITDLSVASYFIEKMKITNLRIAGIIDYEWNLTFASRKDWPILNNILDKGLAAIDQKERQAIYSKWVPSGYEDRFPTKKLLLYIAIILSIIGAGVIFILLWNRTLKRQVMQKTMQLQRELDEHQQTQRTLQNSEEKHRAILHNIPGMVYRGKADWSVEIILNSEIMCGYSEHEFKTQKVNWINLIHPDEKQRVLEEGAKLSEKPMSIIQEYRILDKDGNTRFVRDHKTSLFGDDGTFAGADGIVYDLSDLKQTQEKLDKLHAQLIQAQKMESVGRLAGGVAHDYNNALSVIIGFTELAMEKIDLAEPLHADLNEVLNAARHATDITRQLLAFARKQIVAPVVLDLNDNIETMLKMLRRLIGEDIDLAWLPGPGIWPVKMDPSQVDQILANLCVNAKDAIAGVGKVTIETATKVIDAAYCADHVGFIPGEFVLMTVRDNGCGMDKEILKNIFEPFFTTKEVGKGTGLGLATVYGIVKQNNGFINVYSEPGKGTSFKIYLPRHEGEAAKIQEESTVEILSGIGETILVVEDDLTVLKLAKTILGKLGYSVLIATTPGEALSQAEEHSGKIQLLITDVIMPEMNGYDLANRLQSICPGLKCVFMSGYTRNAIAHHGVLDEGVNFVQKPFSKRELAITVRKVLDEGKNFNS